MNLRYITNVAIYSLALSTFQIGPAFAYMDPGTGSLLLQGLLGGIAGAAVFIRIYWHKLTSWLRWTRSSESERD